MPEQKPSLEYLPSVLTGRGTDWGEEYTVPAPAAEVIAEAPGIRVYKSPRKGKWLLKSIWEYA